MSEAAKRLYASAPVWDAHAGFEPTPEIDLADIALWRRAGVRFLSLNVGYDVMDWRDTVKALARFRDWVGRTDGYRLAGTAAEVEGAIAAGELAIAFDVEGMNALDGSVEMVGLYHALGVRQMLFAYNRNNLAGGGCHDEDVGLTDFGRGAIDAMNRAGMVVDCSHCGYRTTLEAMERSAAPVVFSHSNPRALRDHQRNIRDEQARACAATGGVVGVNGISAFLGQDDISTATLADHVEYLLDLVGPAHVGIGLDYFFDSGPGSEITATIERSAHFWPPEHYAGAKIRCAAPGQLLALTGTLLERGRDEDAVRGVLGENFLRVAREVWKPA